jgi:hypothetical protein
MFTTETKILLSDSGRFTVTIRRWLNSFKWFGYARMIPPRGDEEATARVSSGPGELGWGQVSRKSTGLTFSHFLP